MVNIKDIVWENIERVRKNSPLVLSITNYVVMNNSANALLSIGASPIMSLCEEEALEMVSLCNSVVVNIGTVERSSLQTMLTALRCANTLKKPIVLDPVGVGATSYRKESVEKLLANGFFNYIRANASEIMTMAGMSVDSKGVDSTQSSLNSKASAVSLSKRLNSVVCVSGEVDLVVSGNKTAYINNGSAMLEKVTGMGCTSTAILGAFSAVCDDCFNAGISATSYMGVCGEIAASKSAGPGSLQLNILDVFYNLSKEQYMDIANIELD